MWPGLLEYDYYQGLYTLPISPRTPSEIRPVLAKYHPGLLYVRKKLAVGAFTTCRQVHDEAAGLFWGSNHFSFSGYLGWYVLLRFFPTIGQDAKAHMRCLSVVAPFLPLNGQYSNRLKDILEKQKSYGSQMRLATVDLEPFELGLHLQRCCEMLQKFPNIRPLTCLYREGAVCGTLQAPKRIAQG